MRNNTEKQKDKEEDPYSYRTNIPMPQTYSDVFDS